MLGLSSTGFYEARKGDWYNTLKASMEALQDLLQALEYQPSLVTTMGRSKTLQAVIEVKTLQKTLHSVISQMEAI